MTAYALEVQSLTKVIGKKKVVDQVSFSVNKGEIFGLLGPNGAGKTTIIRMIVSLINRTDGAVIINGNNLDEQFKETMSEMGAIVENPEFYKYMSGYKNLKHYANMALKKVSDERINEVAKLVKLEDVIHQKVKTYSLGMRQRLGVAQALLHNPSLLILDEPTNGLDPQGIREFRDYLHMLARDGISVLVSSHLLSEMQLMCDRFAILEKGKLIHISSMKETMEIDEAKEVVFEVDNSEEAVEVVKEKMEALSVKVLSDHQFSVNVNRADISTINRTLISNDINVYGINRVEASLEDRFFEITNKGAREEVK
ncbi:ABC transporter ATP-binding protein [Pseudalkalibacillus berkeleyi]|uniref:ATP-binding cassette domain-containing protein n=1 Tax=Pseudalkalibacillus berkeleyi TaxID=1069813 RepID=A0ABS9H3R7_9BACL|nr:ATP-binding cassette domain-containing protein [Pseudalkalibacillus berkeleyi]MCF6138295.1 ATP-binding cassette domain-containing protein [Pseudalkalibacillus berkeleyi]